jgi:hypothetical protein
MRVFSAAKIPHVYGLKLAALAVLAAMPMIALAAESDSATKPVATLPSEAKGAAMQQFVLIFRQGIAKQLSPEEQNQRSEEIRSWARKWIEEGYSFDPRKLSQDAYRIDPDGNGHVAEEKPIINLLFLRAKDFDDAVRIAKTHPGVRYGTLIEVRAWTSPGLPAAK